MKIASIGRHRDDSGWVEVCHAGTRYMIRFTASAVIEDWDVVELGQCPVHDESDTATPTVAQTREVYDSVDRQAYDRV